MRAPATSLATVALALVAVAPASADKAPSSSQRAAIAASAGIPARCLIIRISSRSSHYGSLRFDQSKYSSCKRHASDGIAIVRRTNGRWRQRYAGSDCMTPPSRDVPTKVWKDLSRTFCGR
ncbi:hypothetical protein [Patulibacter minatonensis]|uniref:hypothetical protein n=1 Tax=Patulibacter minatonensis TaxID=298163 RepID=UPI00047E97A2|nr:hypothetical protein [Patulibacter minatonensis]